MRFRFISKGNVLLPIIFVSVSRITWSISPVFPQSVSKNNICYSLFLFFSFFSGAILLSWDLFSYGKQVKLSARSHNELLGWNNFNSCIRSWNVRTFVVTLPGFVLQFRCFFYEIVMLFTFWKDFINSRWEESSQIETALQFCLSRALGNTRRKSIASSKIGFWREEGEEGERNVASEAIKGAKGNEGNGSYVFILIFNFGGKE